MSSVKQAFSSSLGLKVVMALSGVILVGFLVAHLIGNSLIFAGSTVLNGYAEALHNNLAMLWLVRIIMLTAVPVHVVTAIKLTRINTAARPIGYAQKTYRRASLASRTMAASGIFLFVFLIFHLAHYTLRVTDPAIASLSPSDVYSMMVTGFSSPYIAGFYSVAVILLGFHLSHGVSSVFQSLGVNHPKWNVLIRKIGPVAGFVFSVGFILIPISILFGFIR